MAASNSRRNLFLQVNGDIAPLRQVLRDGKSAIAEFGGDVGKQLAAVEKAFQTQLSGAGAEKSAREMTAAYTRSFAAIRQQAEEALSRPVTGAGALSLNVPEARQAALAAQTQARALREVADAAGRVAVANGNAKSSEAAYALAAASAANSAELKSREISEQLILLERLQAELDATGVSQARFNNGQRQVTQASAAQRAGFQQLSFQVGDVATQFSSGTPVLQIFAQQTSQVVQAIGLMSGESKGFAGFIGGPWGQLITAGIIVLAPFVAKLWEGAEAAKEAKLGSDGLSDAQGALGKIFDLTSGKLEHQNDLLRLNARLTAINLRATAAADEASAKKTFADSGKPSLLNRFLGSLALDNGTGQQTYLEGKVGAANANAKAISDIAQRVQSGKLKYEDAAKLVEKQSFEGTGGDKAEFLSALAQAASAPLQRERADLIDKSLDNNKLDPSLKRDPPKKTAVDRSAQQAYGATSDFEGDRRALLVQLLGAQRRSAGNDNSRDQLERDAIAAEADGRKKQIAADLGKALADPKAGADVKAIARTRAEELTALTDRVKVQKLANVDIDRAAATMQAAYEAQQDDLRSQLDLLDIQSQMASTRRERLAVERQILERQQQERRNQLEFAKNNPKASDAERARADAALGRLPGQEGAERAALERNNASPIEAYKQRLKAEASDTGDALSGAAVNGLQSLEDGLAGVVSGTQSVKSAFKSMAASIIADLARIAIRKAIVGVLTGGFGFASGGIVQRNASGGRISGPGTGTSDSILSWLSNGEFVVNAASTAKYLPMLHAMNDNRLPRFAEGGLIGRSLDGISMPRLPNMGTLQRDQRAPVSMSIAVDARGASNPAEMEAAAVRVFAALAEPLGIAVQERTVSRLARPDLPGSAG